MRAVPISAAVVAATLIAIPQCAHAYIGPGAGITVIGTVVALVGAISLAIVGFVWYPVKRLRAKWRRAKNGPEPNAEQSEPQETHPT